MAPPAPTRACFAVPGVGPESEDDIGIYSLNVDVELRWATFQSMTSYTDRQISAIVESTSAGALPRRLIPHCVRLCTSG